MKKVGVVVAVLLILGMLVVPVVVVAGAVAYGFLITTGSEEGPFPEPTPPVTWQLEADPYAKSALPRRS